MATPLASPPPPSGTIDAGEVVEVLDQLESERALAGDDGRVVERVAERPAVLGRRLLAAAIASSSVAPPSSTVAP